MVTFLASLFCVGNMAAQDEPLPKPMTLRFSGACSPREMSVEYFITGAFGGYASFVSTDKRLFYYEVPLSYKGKPAQSLKLTIKGARCTTQTFEFPEISSEGRSLSVRLRRAATVEFSGRLDPLGRTSEDRPLVTVAYWAHWKCEYLGLPDCLLAPLHIARLDVKADGTFTARLPDLANDPALSQFKNKGAFELFIRNPRTGEVVKSLRPNNGNGSREIPVAASYPGENTFAVVDQP